MNYKQFCVKCTGCQGITSRAYARAHNGLCKTCVTGEPKKANPRYTCPDCHRENALTEYQVKNRYHCDACTRKTDPQGYYNEVMGHND